MNAKRARKSALGLMGVLMLLYVAYGLTHPPRDKARAQRITAVNAAPRVSMTFSTSDLPASADVLPGMSK